MAAPALAARASSTMTRIAVVGMRSFIGSSWSNAHPSNVTLIPRSDISEQRFFDCDVITNCSINPDFKSGKYQETLDDDLAIARIAERSGKHFVMLSTRKVYGVKQDRTPIDENTSTNPGDFYGANKLESEFRVRSLLGSQCTILRISNVFGYELGRRSFFGLALGRLKTDGCIELDISPFVARDFIPVDCLVSRLSEICHTRPAGVFNLGSGIGIQLGRIAQWLIRGFGRGQLLVTSLEENDSFVLDVAKLQNALGHSWPDIDFEETITAIGNRLTHA